MSDAVPTGRWRGVVAIALVSVTASLLIRRPGVLLIAVIGVAYAAFPRLTTPPTARIGLDRRLSPPVAAPNEEIEVTLTITNLGSNTLFDVRIVDGVPSILSVVGGTPRHGAVLRPGASTSFSYVVRARIGQHPFHPATVVARDLSGAHEYRLSVADDTTIDCEAPGSTPPIATQTTLRSGQVVGDRRGLGVEFDHTRPYRHGDPLDRIDWNRYAARRVLTTTQSRAERAATVVIVVDARCAAYRGPEGGLHAVGRSVIAAEQLFAGLVGNRNLVGLASLGAEPCWLSPGTGREHFLRARERLGSHEAFRADPPATEVEPPMDAQLTTLRVNLPSNAQILLLSPLCDDAVADAARTLRARGYAIQIVSPDPTAADTIGRRLAAVERSHRLALLRRSGIRVVDWPPGESLDLAIATDRRRTTPGDWHRNLSAVSAPPETEGLS